VVREALDAWIGGEPGESPSSEMPKPPREVEALAAFIRKELTQEERFDLGDRLEKYAKEARKAAKARK
jgi:hypothetical protein